jgi:uncharacterized protein
MLGDRGEKTEIALDDGDRLIGRFLKGQTKTVVYLFHGLGGTTEATYMHRTARVVRSLGHSVFMTNHRGCGEGAGHAKHPYHSGRAEDLSSVIAYGRKKLLDHQHIAVGFSLSGNALLLLLSGRRGTIKPDCAMTFNAPINLERASKALMSGLNRIYDFKFVQECRRDINLMRPGEFKVPFYSTLYDFDEIYTGRAGGFKNRQDYYESCSTKDLLSEVKTPTIVITAKDDPFVHFQDYASARFAKSILFHAERVGGHMGYLTKVKTPLGTNRWLDYAVFEGIKQFTA